MRRVIEIAAVTSLAIAFAAGQEIDKQFPTQPSSDQTPDIRDALDPLELPEPNEPPIIAILAGALLLGGVSVWLLRRRTRQRSDVTPEQQASLSLDQLRLDQRNTSDRRSFYAELNRIFVAYIEDRLGFPATRLTSMEILERVDSKWRQAFENFFALCDHGRFSPPGGSWDATDATMECKRLIAMVSSAPRISLWKEPAAKEHAPKGTRPERNTR